MTDNDKRLSELERFLQLFMCVEWDYPTEHDDLLLETLRDMARVLDGEQDPK